MPKGPAKLGYFVSKDQTIPNADNVCVLVVHYNFKDAKTKLEESTQLVIKKDLFRDGDDTDIKNLDETFRKNRKCNFRSLLSPEKGKLLQLLSDREKLLQEFGCSDVPSVFVLYILSHGDRDGVILTDYVKDDVRAIVDEVRDGQLNLSELFVSFTTTDVFESMKNLTDFDECLKFINFGSCRGELKDTIFPARDDNFKNANSCRITYSPLTRNTVVFFSTVETTLANRDPATGTTFIHLTCKVLNTLEKDESLINVLTTIQNEIHKDSVKGIAGQTPEMKMFSQDRIFVISKSPPDFSKSDAMSIKREFYSWKSSTGENMRRRLALLFSAVIEGKKQLNEVQTALSQNLDFETSKLKLSGTSWTSINKASWRDFDIGCIFLIFFGLVTKNLETNEVCVQVDGRETAVSEILREFIGPKNDQWIGKPKILFFVNQETSSFADASGFIQPYMRISATNHSGWLVLVLHNNDELQKLIKIFEGQELKKEESLQEHLASLLVSESKENKDLLNSTLQYPLNFPDWPSSFVQLNFFVTNSHYKKYNVSFDSLVKESATKNQIWLLSSFAGTGKTTILREMAFQLGKLKPQFQILRVSLPRVSFSSLDRNVTEIEFLVKATQNSKEEIIKSIENKQCVVLLDGFDEITRPDNQEKTLRVIEALEKKQIIVWIGTRPNAAEAIKNRISEAVIVKIDPLDEEQQIEFLKLETGKSREECEQFIRNFASKDILENPLHLSLVAKYGAEGNLYQIYDKVVRHKVELSLRDKEGYDESKRIEFNEKIANAMGDLQELASCHIRGVKLADYTKDDLEKNNYYGIASFQNNKVIFIHQTFAEFLAAKHLLREIENCGDCDIQTSTEDIADLFLGKSFSWCRKFVDLLYSTVLNDVEKIEKRRESILRVMKLNPDRFLELVVYERCIYIFKMIYQNISFSNNQEGNFISFAKDKILLVNAIQSSEEIAIMLLDMDLINSYEELLIILPHLLDSVAETNACLFFEKLETKFPALPEMIHSRRSIIQAGVIAARNDHGEILNLLLQNGVDKDFLGYYGSALYLAIFNGAIKCVEVLLKHSAKLAIDEVGDSWDHLMLAVNKNNLDMVKFLLEENISGLQRNKETFEIIEVKSDFNALQFAIRNGRNEIAKFIIDKCPGLKNMEYGNEGSPLKYSAKCRNHKMCQWLVDEAGVDVNTLRPSGEPRDWSSNDNIFMDHFLILQKSDINMTDERGKTALHCAAEHGYLERVQDLIHSGANIRAVDENGWNAFHFACSYRCIEDVIRLLHSADSQLAKETTGSGQTGLHILMESSEYCSVDKARFLVEEIGVDVRAKDNNGCTALRIAVKKGLRFVDYLMTKDINLEVKNKRGQTCLHLAAERGDLEALQTWIELGGDFNVVDEKGMTALHIAAESGHLQFVKKFLVCKTEEVQNQDIGESSAGSTLKKIDRVNRCDNKGRTALHLAAKRGNVDLVELLLENKADLTLTDLEGKNAIHFAIENERMLRFLNEKNGSLVKQRIKDGNTTLHLALDRRLNVTVEITLWIIGQVDDTVLNAKDDSGETPLLLACRNRWWRAAELLMSRNVEVNVADRWGRTAMHYAAKNGNLDLMRLLLKKGTDLTLTDNEGMNAIHLAAKKGNLDLVKLLHEKGADLTLTDNEGMNAIHLAAKKGNLDLVKLLHEKGADLTLTDNEGMNALHHAINNMEVFSFIYEKNGALLNQQLKNGFTILHKAVMDLSDGTKVIPFILEQCEIDLNVTNSEGETPLVLACKERKWIIAKILVAKGADIHVKDINGRTALHYVVQFTGLYENVEHAFDLMQELCKRGANLALTDNDGMNAFHHAIKNFHMALFIHKLNGNLVKQRSNNGDTSLHLAIKLNMHERNNKIISWLVEHCENDLNVSNNEGETPLVLACKNKEWRFGKILQAKTVDINARDKNGRTALHYASQSWREDALELLQELYKRGADLALTDNDGMNAFHHAIENYNMALEIHNLNGDLVKQRLNNGDTSLHLAIKSDRFSEKDILIWLLEHFENYLNLTNSEGPSEQRGNRGHFSVT